MLIHFSDSEIPEDGYISLPSEMLEKALAALRELQAAGDDSEELRQLITRLNFHIETQRENPEPKSPGEKIT